MSTEDELKILIDAMSQMPRRQSEQYAALRDQLYATVREIIYARLQEGAGTYTPELRAIVDQLYDLPGTAPVLAEALGFEHPYHLRQFLARKVVVHCHSCGGKITVEQPRRKGGYTVESSYKCDDCRKTERETWSYAAEQAAAERKRHAEAMHRLGQVKEPTSVLAYKAHLANYLDTWQRGAIKQFAWNYATYVGTGCMICGWPDVHLLLTTTDSLKTYADLVELYEHDRSIAREGEQNPVVMMSIHQILFDLHPETYFVCIPHYPITRLPVLVACQDCCDRLELTDSHVIVDVDMGDEENSGG